MLVGGAAIGKEMATILRITFGRIQASRAELTYFLKDPYFDPSMGLSLREQSGGNKGYDAPLPTFCFVPQVIQFKSVFQHDLLLVVKEHARILPVETCSACQACGLW